MTTQHGARFSSSKIILGLQVGISVLLVAFGGVSYQHDSATDQAFKVVKEEKLKALNIGRLDSELKSIQLSVVQVQQFLTDVSATRGMNGLDDGYELAEQNAQAFSKHLETATALATELHEDGIAEKLKVVGAGFAPYYATGKQMAAAYVAEGPAGGNKLEAKGVKLGKGAKAVAALQTADKKTVTVRFTVK